VTGGSVWQNVAISQGPQEAEAVDALRHLAEGSRCSYYETMHPKQELPLFDEFLAERGLQLEAVVIGGAALNVLGTITRGTHDCDLMVPPELPPDVSAAAREFARRRRAAGIDLKDDWLNSGPSSLAKELPAGWEKSLRPLLRGRALRLHTLGRLDLLRSKLYALCDRGTDKDDCKKMRPTLRELVVIEPWLVQRDGNLLWPEHVREVLGDLAQDLGIEWERGRGGRGL
jgi:hypothetical protein